MIVHSRVQVTVPGQRLARVEAQVDAMLRAHSRPTRSFAFTEACAPSAAAAGAGGGGGGSRMRRKCGAEGGPTAVSAAR